MICFGYGVPSHVAHRPAQLTILPEKYGIELSAVHMAVVRVHSSRFDDVFSSLFDSF